MTTQLAVELHSDGPALWPRYITAPDLEASREDLGTPIFETMYQSRRGGLAGQFIRDEWFRYYRGSPPGICYGFLDPAISVKTTADESALVIANVNIEHIAPSWGQSVEAWEAGTNEPPPTLRGQIYFRWYWHGRVGIREQEEVITEAWRYYRPVAIGVEDVAYQAALVQLLLAEHPELPIEGHKPERDKTSRHLSLARFYEFGRAYHHPDMRASAFEWQLTHLPGRHDDMADAAAGILQLSGLLSGAVTVNQRPPGFL